MLLPGVDLDARLIALKANPLFEAMPLLEALDFVWAPFRTVASVKGSRTVTCILRQDEQWVRLRVPHWSPTGDGTDGMWENLDADLRIAALSRPKVVEGDFITVALHVSAWAHEQDDYTGKSGIVIMTMSDWGKHGSAKKLLAQVAALDHGADVNAVRTLAGLQGHRFP